MPIKIYTHKPKKLKGKIWMEYYKMNHRACMTWVFREIKIPRELKKIPEKVEKVEKVECMQCIRNPFPAELLPDGQPPTCIDCIATSGVYHCCECIRNPFTADLLPDRNNPQCIECIASDLTCGLPEI